jgi:proteasome lid subunit RPN8/RPN11
MTRRPLPEWGRGVKDAIYDHIYSSPGGEVGGVLVGEIPEQGPVRIDGAIAALSAEGERASVTFTHDAWSEVHDQLERNYPGCRIVGWYHSHPGFGIFLSEHDLFIQRNFFGDPAQVAYVVDPHASTEGLFGWVDGEIVQVESSATPRKPTRGALPAGMEPDRVRTKPPLAMAPIVGALAAGVIVGGVLWFTALRPASDEAPSPAPAGVGTTSTPASAGTTPTIPTVTLPPPGAASASPAATITSEQGAAADTGTETAQGRTSKESP